MPTRDGPTLQLPRRPPGRSRCTRRAARRRPWTRAAKPVAPNGTSSSSCPAASSAGSASSSATRRATRSPRSSRSTATRATRTARCSSRGTSSTTPSRRSPTTARTTVGEVAERRSAAARRLGESSYWKSQIAGSGPGYSGHGITNGTSTTSTSGRATRSSTSATRGGRGHCTTRRVDCLDFAEPKGRQGFAEADMARDRDLDARLRDRAEVLPRRPPEQKSRKPRTEKPKPDAGQALDADVSAFHDALIDVVKKQGSVALVDFRAEWKDGRTDTSRTEPRTSSPWRRRSQKPDTGATDEQVARTGSRWSGALRELRRQNTDGTRGEPGLRLEARVLLRPQLRHDGQGRPGTPANNFTKCVGPDRQDTTRHATSSRSRASTPTRAARATHLSLRQGTGLDTQAAAARR